MAHFCEKYDSFEIHTGETLDKNSHIESLGLNEDDIFAIIIYFNNYAVFAIVRTAKIVSIFFVIL
jgi:hypothetical protein